MKIFQGRLNREVFIKLPVAERRLFVTIAHLQNEIRFALRGVLWSSDYSSGNDVVVQGQLSLSFFYLKILAGKLYEGWQLLKKNYFANKELSQELNSSGSKETLALLKELGKYFGKNNLISEVRNSLSFHYSPEELDNHLINLPDELDLYIEKETDANTLYYFAEVLANRAVLSKLNNEFDVNQLTGLNNEVLEIAKKFNKFNMLYMSFVIKKYSPEIWDGVVKEVHFDDLMPFSKIKIPMFADTTDGIIKSNAQPDT